MTAMIFVGLAAIGFGGWMFYQARGSQQAQRKLLGTETSTTGLLRELMTAATEAAGPGSFSEHVEVEGTAQPGAKGLLTSEVSKTECVWHRHQVTRKYKDVTTDSEGKRRTTTREEVVAKNTTKEPFLLRDADGDVTIVPSTAVKGARKSVSEFREAKGRNKQTKLELGSFSLSLPTADRDGETIGYQYEEWVLTADTPIFVQGEAVDRNGKLQIRDPKGKEKLLITTSSEDELLDEVRGDGRKNLLFGAGAVVAGLAAIVYGIVG